MNGYRLTPVTTSELWAALHGIRREVLFEPGRHAVPLIYDDNHPDDHKPENQPFVLLFNGVPIGITRLDDIGGERGVVRLVAIVKQEQRRGHGRSLGALIDAEATRRGMRKLFVNSAPDAVGYYKALGWELESWAPAELAGIAADCVQMSKSLG